MSNSISNNIFCNHIERFTRRPAIKGRSKLRFINSSEPRINIIRISSQAWGGFSPLTTSKKRNPSKLKVEKDWGLAYSKAVSMFFGLIAYTYIWTRGWGQREWTQAHTNTHHSLSTTDGKPLKRTLNSFKSRCFGRV